MPGNDDKMTPMEYLFETYLEALDTANDEVIEDFNRREGGQLVVNWLKQPENLRDLFPLYCRRGYYKELLVHVEPQQIYNSMIMTLSEDQQRDFIQYNDFCLLKSDHYQVFESMVTSNDFRAIEWLLQLCPEELRQSMIHGYQHRSFLLAVEHGQFDMVKRLWAYYDENWQQFLLTGARQAIQLAAHFKHFDICRWLTEQATEETKKIVYGSHSYFPIELFLINADLEMIEWVWQQFPDADWQQALLIVPHRKYSLFNKVAESGRLDSLQWMFKQCPDFIKSDSFFKENIQIFAHAAKSGNVDLINWLWQQFPVSYQDLIKKTYAEEFDLINNLITQGELVASIEAGDKELVRQAIACGIDISRSVVYHGEPVTPLCMAAKVANISAIAAIYQTGYDFNQEKNNYPNPLEAAIVYGGEMAVGRLIYSGWQCQPESIPLFYKHGMLNKYITHLRSKDVKFVDIIESIIQKLEYDLNDIDQHAKIAQLIIEIIEKFPYLNILTEIADAIGIGYGNKSGDSQQLAKLRYRNLARFSLHKKMGYRETNDSEVIARELIDTAMKILTSALERAKSEEPVDAKEKSRWHARQRLAKQLIREDDPDKLQEIIDKCRLIFDRQITRNKSPKERQQRLEQFEAILRQIPEEKQVFFWAFA